MATNTTFTIDAAGPLTVLLHGRPLISSDALVLAELENGEQQVFDKTGAWQQVTTLHGDDRASCAWYREVAENPERLEINWNIRYAPYQFGRDVTGHKYNDIIASYDLMIPAAFFEGGRYKAVVGTFAKRRVVEGSLDKEPGNNDILKDVLYLTFSARGTNVTFDLNPAGTHSKIYMQTLAWSLLRAKEHYILRATFGGLLWGDEREFKIVITPRGWEYEQIHTDKRNPARPIPMPSFVANCGNVPVKKSRKIDCSAYTSKSGFGWVEPAEMSIVTNDISNEPADIYRECIRGNGKAVLRVDAPDGVYLVNLVFGAASEDSSPFEVTAGGKVKLKGLQTEKGRFQAKTIYTHVTDGQALIGFEGEKWFLCALSLAPLVYDGEDYLFRRKWFVRQAEFDDWLARVEPVPALSPAEPAIGTNGMDWTWNGSMESLAGSLLDFRAGLNTPETVRYRLEQINSGGFHGAVIHGQHFRFNYLESHRHAVLLRNTRLAVEEAHKLGLRLVDHWDLNWVFYSGYPLMLRLLEQDPDCLQRSANPLVISAAFCLNSEVFTRFFEDYVCSLQRATGLDGHMIDEVSWITSPDTFCYCDNCRRLFETETGIRLPLNLSKIISRSGDATWRALKTWHGRKKAALNGRLRDALRSVRPDGIMLSYTSSFLSSSYAGGNELNQNPLWNVDYVGDEFHPDIVLQNWRVIFARIKNRQGATASWRNAPTWILPKFKSAPNRTMYAWALGRMNRANIWSRSWDYNYSRKLNTFAEQMRDRDARPLSDVAVLLSQSSRDLYDEANYYHTEQIAWLETLAEENIQYDVIIDRDLTPGKLARYAAVVLPNAAAVSDSAAKNILEYARSGGRVIATFETGFYDEAGNRRPVPAFAEAMNLKDTGEASTNETVRMGEVLSAGTAKADFQTPAKQRMITLSDAKRSRVLATSRGPAVVETVHGKGAIYYLAGNYLSQNFEERAVSAANITTLKGRSTYKVHFNRDLNVMARNLMSLVLGERRKTQPIILPDGVVFTAFVENADGRENIVLHLLNCSGKPTLKYGDEVLRAEDAPQPPLPGDMEILVRSDKPIRSGYVADPLREGRRPVDVQPGGKGAWRVRISKGDLTNYAIVRLE